MAMEMLQLEVHGQVWVYYGALSWRSLLSRFIFLYENQCCCDLCVLG